MAVQRNPAYANSSLDLLDPLVEAFRLRERSRIRTKLRDLLARNSALGGTRYAFLHEGRIYSTIALKYFDPTVKPLHESLHEDGEKYVELADTLDEACRKLRQALAVILPRCRNNQDVRDALPETLVVLLSELSKLPRQRPEGFLLEDNPLLKRQYDQAVELALYYQGLHLIY